MFRIIMNDKAFLCSGEETVLKAARRQMIKVPYGCANGGCGMCKVKITKGDYRMETHSKAVLSDDEFNNRLVLLCKTYPFSNVKIELVTEKVK